MHDIVIVTNAGLSDPLLTLQDSRSTGNSSECREELLEN